MASSVQSFEESQDSSAKKPWKLASDSAQDWHQIGPADR